MIHRIICTLCVLVLSLNAQSQSLNSPESIVWDEMGEQYLVSNAGDGAIRILNASGDSKLFGTDARGSHGLTIVADYLYACNRTSIYVYNLRTEGLVQTLAIPGASFLNGICHDFSGNLYVTDFTNRLIFKLEIDSLSGEINQIEKWYSTKVILNGIAFNRFTEELVVLTWGGNADILIFDVQEADISKVISTDYNNLEGLWIGDEGDVYISAWSPGAVLRFEPGMSSSPIELDMGEVEKPTGLVVSPEGDLIILDSEAKNVSALRTSEKSGTSNISLNAFPNPITINSLISYNLKRSEHVVISVYNCQGKLVENLVAEDKVAGDHQFFYERGDYPSGLYFINIQCGSENEAIAITVVD